MSYDEGLAADAKISRIAGDRMEPGEQVTLTDEELNSYLHYVYAEELPEGVRGLRVVFKRDIANVRAVVDFANLSEGGDGPGFFLMMLLRGEREVQARVHYVSANGEARIDIESLLVDGREMKGSLLDWLVNRYVAPNMEGFALGEPAPLGHHIEQIRLEAGQAVISAEKKFAD